MHQTSDPPFSKFTRQAGKILESVGQGYYGFCQTDQTWSPSVNLYETAEFYRVCVDLAGVEKDRIDLSVRQQVLVIAGERPVPKGPPTPPASTPATPHARGSVDQQRVRVHRMEIDHGPFVREVELPEDVDQDAISATYRNGLLWIELPKRRP